MGWIKRNLLFVIVGVVALLSLGGAGFFIWLGWSHNSETSTQLNEIYGKLKELADAPLKPGEGQTNTFLAKEQERQLADWIQTSGQYFQPIQSIPPGTNVASSAYADSLRQTIDYLQHEAEAASVTLPPKYDFSFSAQRSLLRFAPGSLDPLAQQLGEVKTIASILFAARVNALDSIQRVRVSEDDAQGLQSDYTELRPITNDLAVITPYIINFRSFTPELARVISGFSKSVNPFIVKSVLAQPASGATTPDQAGVTAPGYPYPGAPGMDPRMAMDPRYRYAAMAAQANPEQTPAAQTPTGKGGLPTVLKEQLLHITLEVDIVKLLPKS
jgi:hypothetical protein